MTDFETLGAFYLGKRYDLASRERQDDLVLYDSQDLTTHAVIIGMTGSGKTGLGIGLIEEALIDHIPVIAVDPKGDLANLALRFPNLVPADFQPWVDPQQAAAAGVSVDEFAAQQAAQWKKGLESWGQSGQRIQRLIDAADVSIYTPGSTAGRSLSLLRAFDAPSAEVVNDNELLQEKVSATTSSLLTLAGLNAATPTSREHILIANLLTDAWQQGRSLDLPGLITGIQSPPFSMLGVMPLDTVFPPKDRTGLAMQLNNLLAAPGFQSWLEGEPLDTASLLHTAQGKPRCSVISIAHLDDAQRMAFMTLLLSDVVSWVRSQPGTSSLRAIIYIDELFGFMPPVANPPSKALLLTLLKQARAFGVGVVLASQNPVDLDYRGLSNAGTWFIGRMQAERDKLRVMDGLEGAASAGDLDRAALDKAISGLGKRVFLLHNVHEKAPYTFETRWAMSYLAGPMTREQIRSVTVAEELASRSAAGASGSAPLTGDSAMQGAAAAITGAAAAPTATASAGAQTGGTSVAGALDAGALAAGAGTSSAPPVLAHDIRQFWMPLSSTNATAVEYQPAILGLADVSITNAKLGVSEQRRVTLLARIDNGPIPVDWNQSERLTVDAGALGQEAPASSAGQSYAGLPSVAGDPRNYAAWSKSLQRWVLDNERLMLLQSPALKLSSQAGESERDFRIRLQQKAREVRDEKIDALRRKYQSKVDGLDEKLRRAQQAVQREEQQAGRAKFDTAVSFGSVILGALFNKGRVSSTSVGKLGTAARGMGRAREQAADVGRANETVEALMQQKAALVTQMEDETETLQTGFDSQADDLEEIPLSPRSSDVRVQFVALIWLPVTRDSTGIQQDGWR